MPYPFLTLLLKEFSALLADVNQLPRSGPVYVLPPVERIIHLPGDDEMTMRNVRDYTLALPPKAAIDDLRRQILLDNSGHPDLPSVFSYDIELGGDFPVEQAVTLLEGIGKVAGTLTDYDNAGNAHPSTSFEIDTTDTTATEQSGPVTSTFTGERLVDLNNIE